MNNQQQHKQQPTTTNKANLGGFKFKNVDAALIGQNK